MPTDRQRVLLADITARGPAHPGDLAWHPVIRDEYRPWGRFEVRDDLESLVDAGALAAITDDVDGQPATMAYDVVDANRPNRDARLAPR